MAYREPPSRDRQIELMVNAETRASKFIRKWIAKPEFKAALHRHDRAKDGNHGGMRKVAGR